jgi:hypothetical protein
MEPKVKLGQYQHFKGKYYEVIAVGKDCETLEDTVIYKALYQTEHFPMGQVWTISLDNFVEEVKIEGIKIPRFKYVG